MLFHIDPTVEGGLKKLVLFIVSICILHLYAGDTGANTISDQIGLTFPAPQQDFSKYEKQAANYLLARAMPHRSEGEIKLNKPFQLQANQSAPYRGKFLLIHGLNDSPYLWRDSATVLARKGFDVRAILLPGHGTSPADLLSISYRSWLSAAREHFALWNTDDTPIYIGGFSLGGILATILALENQDIDGLLLFSPAYHSKLNSYLRWSWLYAKFKPWLFGGMILEDNPVKYNSIPINSGSQYYKTTQYLKRKWGNKKLDIPTLVVITEQDSVVDVSYVRRIFSKRFVSKNKRLLLYSNNPDTPVGHNEQSRNSRFMAQRILSLSHLGVLYSPDNPLFGESRKILVCNGNEFPIFMACMRSNTHWYGAQHAPSPDQTPVARSTYNPDFDSIFEVFDSVFLE